MAMQPLGLIGPPPLLANGPLPLLLNRPLMSQAAAGGQGGQPPALPPSCMRIFFCSWLLMSSPTLRLLRRPLPAFSMPAHHTTEVHGACEQVFIVFSHLWHACEWPMACAVLS